MALPKRKEKEKKMGMTMKTRGLRSETSSLAPRNLSFSSNRTKIPKSPDKLKSAAGSGSGRWPPNGDSDDDGEEDGGGDEDEDDDDDESGHGSYTGIEIVNIDHAKLYAVCMTGSLAGPRSMVSRESLRREYSTPSVLMAL